MNQLPNQSFIFFCFPISRLRALQVSLPDLHAALIPSEDHLAVGTLVSHGVKRVNAAWDAGAEREAETKDNSFHKYLIYI